MNDANQKKNAARTEPCGTPQVSEGVHANPDMRGRQCVYHIYVIQCGQRHEVNDSTRRMSRPSLDQIGLHVVCDLKPV